MSSGWRDRVQAVRRGIVSAARRMWVHPRRRREEGRAQIQSALLRLSTSQAASRGDLEAAAREITTTGVDLLDVERCGVWFLRREDDATLECLDLYCRTTAQHASGETLRAESYPAYFAALRRQRTVAAHDAGSDERTRELGAYLAEHRITAMLDSPIHAGGRLVGVVCHEHVGTAPRRWSSDEESTAGSLADCAARALDASERSRAERDLRRAYDQLARVTWRMEAAKEEERRHIARELHDELGQSLTAIKLNLALLAAGADASARARLEETTGIVDASIRATRELSRAMRPPLLDEVGLVAALRAFVDEQARRSSLAFRLFAPTALGRGAPELEIAAFRIVQEAVTNVLRHAEASSVSIELTGADQSLGLVVRDDGRGFDTDAIFGRIEDGHHLGLVGMRERARALGGRFDVSSTAGQGTEIRVVLPTGQGGVA
jgi:signal transduction histidine kinase